MYKIYLYNKSQRFYVYIISIKYIYNPNFILIIFYLHFIVSILILIDKFVISIKRNYFLVVNIEENNNSTKQIIYKSMKQIIYKSTKQISSLKIEISKLGT